MVPCVDVASVTQKLEGAISEEKIPGRLDWMS